MRHILNCIGLLCLLVLLSTTSLATAQDKARISVVGSGVANAIVEALADAGQFESLKITTTGTAAGIDQFCNGDIDIASASRAISAAENAICISNEVQHSEFLIAHKIVAFVANSDVPLQCLSLSDLQAFVKPSSGNQIIEWSDYGEAPEGLSLTAIVPQETTLEFVIVDNLVVGDRLRRDVLTYADQTEALRLVNETQGALAILAYSAEIAANQDSKSLTFSGDSAAECVEPSAETVEANLYNAAQSIYLYVNRSHLESNESLKDFMQAVVDESSSDTINSTGFTPVSAGIYELNQTMLQNPESARSVGDGATEFEIPVELRGDISISVAANAYRLLDRIASELARGNDQLQVNIDATGKDAAINSLCADEVDIVSLDATLTDRELEACNANSIVAVPLNVGAQATVILGNAADEHTECLTSDQIAAVWQASTTAAVESWSEVHVDLPEQQIVLFGLTSVDRYADILLRRDGEVTPPIRRDTEQDYDPLYRAAAVGNVPGSLTYMSWIDYLNVLESGQANVHLVGVDAGSGCVLPSVASVSDGSYPLSRPAKLLVNELALADVNVQSLLWSLYSDQGWASLEREGFAGVERAQLPSLRRELETQFRLAEAKAAAVEEAIDQDAAEDADEDTSADESG